eukprot:2188_1
MSPLLLLVTYTQLTLFHVSSQIFAENIGTGAPPLVWNGYNMIEFPVDTRSGPPVNDAPSPFDSNPIQFSTPVFVKQPQTWSHEYDGSVYDTVGSSKVTLTFPVGTSAFIFYMEPKMGVQPMTVTYNDGPEFMATVDTTGGTTGFAASGAMLTTVKIEGALLFFGEFLISTGTQTPTNYPTMPTKVPTNPTNHPTNHPTIHPTNHPTTHPTNHPT